VKPLMFLSNDPRLVLFDRATGRKYRHAILRNAPCPCKSGRKFKRCCLLLRTPIAPVPDTAA
jgi:uncharacterized protein YecA (UPF0149 family)